ncbi:hypothetical protein BCR35DRAFT_328377 [Leucosporidium creatinivorum]|uniref:Uncharacterized protein n=1 Tax=Leucosporidium creatinivorum TaxID=106004 RepID=A0A1Y2G5L4_9BASI|nr:hypothetical protein BCR35DRAFT_328377 [Leucosporidium creatinivorum]
MTTPSMRCLLCFTPTTRTCTGCSTTYYCTPEHAALFASSHDKIRGKDVALYDEPALSDAEIDGLVRSGGEVSFGGQPLDTTVRNLAGYPTGDMRTFWTTPRPTLSPRSLSFFHALARAHLTYRSFYAEGPSTSVDPFRSLSVHKITAFPFPESHPPSQETKDRQQKFLYQALVLHTLLHPRRKAGANGAEEDPLPRLWLMKQAVVALRRIAEEQGQSDEERRKLDEGVKGLEEMVDGIAVEVMLAVREMGRG